MSDRIPAEIVERPSATASRAVAGPRAAEDGLLDPREMAAFLDHVYVRTGLDFGHYCRRSMQRRIRSVMQQLGITTLAELRKSVADDAAVIGVAERLCVRVTSMFRDPPFWAALRTNVVPLLRQLPSVRVWHVGCSTGEEVYSLAILMREEGLQQRVRIYATDVDESALEQARAGAYSLDRVREYARNYLQAGGSGALCEYYNATSDGVVLHERLRRGVVFSRHDVAKEASFNEFHVVLCRNVLIYFEATLQRRAHDVVWKSLAPGGVLALGDREVVPRSLAHGRYALLAPPHRIYRRAS